MGKTIVLVGGGHAHLAVLRDWARRPVLGASGILVSEDHRFFYSGMIPGWMAGHYKRSDFELDLNQIATKASARFIRDRVVKIDLRQRLLGLESGTTLPFDILSLATGGEIDRSYFGLLGDRLIPAKPTYALLEGWKKIMRAARAGPIQLAIVGAGAAGVELALAAWTGLKSVSPESRICLVAPRDSFVAQFGGKVRHSVFEALADRGISTYFAEAVASEHGLILSNETIVPADFVIAATGSVAGNWIRASGLQHAEGGRAAVGPDLRSISHQMVFAAGDISVRVDRHVSKSGVHALKAGSILAMNLRRSIARQPLAKYNPRRTSLYILSLGDRTAIASWGPLAWTGKLAWHLKNWIDCRFVRRQRASYVDAMVNRPTFMTPLRSKAVEMLCDGGARWPALSFAVASVARPVVLNAAKVSLVVGTGLNLINQGRQIFGDGAIDWFRVCLNYAVPYAVATYSAVKVARLNRPQNEI